ncbi:Nnf2 protein [Saccharomycopsis crataegensis]|uniref:Nnf2 protein n=1 Tax=Saccharomycopsis crataegensis TaxID=43959 RepID=A0AAV5QW28_9ASCO|nr:Nnf2 protein [Saccharomycopsis crataegensis]
MPIASVDTESSTILPSKPLRDAIALLVVLYKIPTWLNCIFLVVYTLSGSSQAITSRVLAKMFKKLTKKSTSIATGAGDTGIGDVSDINELMNGETILQNNSNNLIDDKGKKRIRGADYLEWLSEFLNSQAVSLVGYLVAYVWLLWYFPNILNLFILSAKAMISVSVFGIHGSKGLLTSVMLIFVVILTTTSFHFFMSKITSIQSTSVLVKTFQIFNSIDTQLESKAFKISYDSNIFNYHKSSSISNFFNSFWSTSNNVFSMHVILMNLPPNFKVTNFMKNHLKPLDQLSKISSDIGANDNDDENDEPQQQQQQHAATIEHETNEALSFNISEEYAQSKLNQIITNSKDSTSDPTVFPTKPATTQNDDGDYFNDSPASFPDEAQEVVYSNHLSSALSAVISNLENFCRLPFIPSSTTKKTRKIFNVRESQPLWSVISALLAMRKRPDIFSGERTVEDLDENNSLVPIQEVRYSNFSFADDSYPVKCFIDYVGPTSMAFQVIQFTKPTADHNRVDLLKHIDIAVVVNGIEWNTHTYEDYIIIIGLTPSSTYDISILALRSGAEDVLVAKYIICTLLDGEGHKSLNSAKIESPIDTLKRSVTTTKNTVFRERVKLKKLKKENTKALGELSKEIDTLNNKTTEANRNDDKLWRKVASLKTEANQLRDEIATRKKELEHHQHKFEQEFSIRYQLKKHDFEKRQAEFKKLEAEFTNEIGLLDKDKEQLQTELAGLTIKNEKLKNKLTKYQSDLQKTEQDIKQIVDDDLNARKVERGKRNAKRANLINEFRAEIQKAEEMTKDFQEKANKLEQEEKEFSNPQ